MTEEILHQRIAELKDKLARSEEKSLRHHQSLQSLVSLTQTFVSLSLTERSLICQTLITQLGAMLDAQYGAVLLSDDGIALSVQGTLNVEAESLLSAEASQLWASVMLMRTPQTLSFQSIRAIWPEAPSWMQRGIAAVAIEVQEQPVGVLFLCDRQKNDVFHDEELELMAASGTVAAMTLTNAELHSMRESLLADIERQATEAKRVAQEKENALRELDEKLKVIEAQRHAIRELSTPILEIWKDVIALPIIGQIDSARSSEMTERLLTAITSKRARYVILDVTGVEVVDTQTADHLVKMVQGAKIVGAVCIVTGVRPAVAETMVAIGLEVGSLIFQRTLQNALAECLKRMGVRAA